MNMYIPVSFLLLLGVVAILFGVWAMKHPKAMKAFIWGFVVFFGCCGFPIRLESLAQNISGFITFLCGYAMIGAGLSAVYGEGKWKWMYPRVFVLTIVGMACRYFLEFGEVSNTYNFTALNIVTYLLIAPLMTILVYVFSGQRTEN